MLRRREGRKASPSAAVIDSQTVKTTEVGGERGYDAGKKINGRKRHVVVETLGLVLAVVVHAANVQDYDGAVLVLGVLGRLKRRESRKDSGPLTTVTTHSIGNLSACFDATYWLRAVSRCRALERAWSGGRLESDGRH